MLKLQAALLGESWPRAWVPRMLGVRVFFLLINSFVWCVCACVSRISVHICVERRGQCWVSSSTASHLCVLRQDLSLHLCFSESGWAGSSREASRFHLPSPGITDAHCPTQFFYMGADDGIQISMLCLRPFTDRAITSDIFLVELLNDDLIKTRDV